MRVGLVIVAAAALGATAFALDAQRVSLARAAVVKGEKLLAKGKAADAEKAFRSAIDIEARLPTSHLGLARTLVTQQRFAEALPVLEQTKDRYVAWEKLVRQTQLELQQDAERKARALADLQVQQVSKIGPSGPNPAQQQVMTRTSMELSRAQTEDYLAKREWRPEQFKAIPAEVFYLAGLANARNGERDRAIDEWLLCIGLEPGNGLAHYNLAVAMFARGEVTLAKEHLDDAVAAGVEPNPAFAADLEQAARALAPLTPTP
jgi:tetratricopeptide (TPR) repeat protein